MAVSRLLLDNFDHIKAYWVMLGKRLAQDAGMTLIVHPNTYHPVVGYLVLGDAVVVTKDGCEVLTQTPRELFSVPA